MRELSFIAEELGVAVTVMKLFRFFKAYEAGLYIVTLLLFHIYSITVIDSTILSLPLYR